MVAFIVAYTHPAGDGLAIVYADVLAEAVKLFLSARRSSLTQIKTITRVDPATAVHLITNEGEVL